MKNPTKHFISILEDYTIRRRYFKGVERFGGLGLLTNTSNLSFQILVPALFFCASTIFFNSSSFSIAKFFQ